MQAVLGLLKENDLPCEDPHVDNTLVKHSVFIRIWRLRNHLCPGKKKNGI